MDPDVGIEGRWDLARHRAALVSHKGPAKHLGQRRTDRRQRLAQVDGGISSSSSANSTSLVHRLASLLNALLPALPRRRMHLGSGNGVIGRIGRALQCPLDAGSRASSLSDSHPRLTNRESTHLATVVGSTPATANRNAGQLED